MYRYCKKILSLPFLPHEQTPGALYELKSLCSKDGLKEFLTYVEKQWIRNNFFDPTRWSIYMEKIRTNNDLEGWHHRLNYKAKRGQLQFYLLIELLHKEGSLVTIQTKLVSTGKLRRQQCKKYQKIQGNLKKIWKRYNRGSINVDQLLSACSHLTV